MSTPIRLRDDPARSGRLHDDLDAARDALHPPCDGAEGAARLEAAIRAGAVPPEPPSPPSIVWTRVVAHPATWWSAGLVGLACLTVVAWWARPHAASAPLRAPSSQHAPSVSVAAEPGQPPVLEAPAVAPVTEAPVTETPPPAPSPVATARASRAHAPAASDWREEMRLLDQARLTLGRDPAAALALVRSARRAFPRGLYGEERDALEVQALLALGRAREGEASGRRFLARHPRGPFTERIRSALEANPQRAQGASGGR